MGNHSQPKTHKPLYWVPNVTDPNYPPNDPRNAGNKGLNPVYGGHIVKDADGKPTVFTEGADGTQPWIDGQVPAHEYDNVNPWEWDNAAKRWVRL